MTQQPHNATPDVDSIIMGGGGPPSAKFDEGIEVGGRVVSVQQREERAYDRDNPGRGPIKTYPSGDTIWGIVVTVATNQRTDADDDGLRRIFVEGQRMKGAVREAILGAGARTLEIGGELYVTKTGKESVGQGIEANTWAARFVPAAQAALMGQQPQPQQPPSGYSAQPQQPPQQQPQPGYAPQQPQPSYAGQGSASWQHSAPPQQQPQSSPVSQQPSGAPQTQPSGYTGQPQQQPQQQPEQQPGTTETGGHHYSPEQIAVMRQAGIPIPGQ